MNKLSLENLNRLSVEAFKQAKKLPICIVLDDIRSMNNVGSVFRTSDAFRIEKIFLCGITAQPPHRDIEKTAIGATQSVEWEYSDDVVETITTLKNNGWKILAIEQAEESTLLNDFQPSIEEKYCIVMGNEVFGVNQEVMNACDICLEIPQFGTKHSLNISVATGIVCWDIVAKLIAQKGIAIFEE